MGKLKNNILDSKDILNATNDYRKADRTRAAAAEKLAKEKLAKKEALLTLRRKQGKALEDYDKAVEEALAKAKRHFGNQKFTATDLAWYTGLDISAQEFASWVWHYTQGGSYRHLGRINYHLPNGTKTTGVRTVTKKFAELDENGQPIPGTEFTREHNECALYWFE